MKRTAIKPRRTSKRQARSEFLSDSSWREAVVEWLGGRCSVPECQSQTNPYFPTSRTVQIDHIIPRSQGGLSDLYNGWPLCVLHHGAKTAGELKIDPAWLRPEHITYLAARGWVEWTIDDTRMLDLPDRRLTPSGHGYRHFLPMRLRGEDIV